MARHDVKIVEDFKVEFPVGALVIREPRTGYTATVAPPTIHTTHYKAGTTVEFFTKQAALNFCTAHGIMVNYVGKRLNGK